MKQVYADITLKPGPHIAGITLIKVAPREWLNAIVETDFNSGKVITPVTFITGKTWITLEFAPKSYEYDDKPKSNKSGAYSEISVSGIINNYNADVQQTISSLKYSELVSLVYDKNKRIKIIGNTDTGMTFTAEKIVKNNLETVQVSLSIDLEDSPPYYEV